MVYVPPKGVEFLYTYKTLPHSSLTLSDEGFFCQIICCNTPIVKSLCLINQCIHNLEYLAILACSI